MALGIYFVLIAGNSIIRPYYLGFLNKDINLKFLATSEKNTNALANNIRIDHIAVNGKDIDLSEVAIPDNSAWDYDSENDFLYVYETSEPEELGVNLSNVHSLTISMVQETGSGIVDIYLDNQLWKTADLYKNAEWDSIKYSFDTSILVFPEKHLVLQTVVIAILWMICFIWKVKYNVSERGFAILIRIAILVCLSVIVIGCVSLVQYGSVDSFLAYFQQQPQSFLKAAVFVFLCMKIIIVITDRVWAGFLLTSSILSLASLVSRVKLMNRDIPLLPWDFSMAQEAVSVINNYEISITLLDILVFLLIILLTIFLFCLRKKVQLNTGTRIIISTTLLLLTILFVQSSFIHCEIEANNTNYRVYQVNNYFEDRGFVSAFLEYLAYLNPSEEPENYSLETMEDIVDEIKAEPEKADDARPTIIAVMSESFWDIERVDTLDFAERVLPNYNSLKSEGSYGELFTHVFNGGTVETEFEFLTGFSGEFFPNDYMVYGNFLDQGFASAVGILKAQGYNTMAFHPYIASNYNRETAYRNLGFDELYFEDAFNNPEKIRNYVSDSELFKKVISKYNENRSSGNPQFIFAVTMQNHGGYWGDTIYEEGLVDYSTDVYGEVARQSIDDYVAGLHESDRALGELVDYFRNVDDDVIIVYFGDHVSNAGPKDDRMLEQTSWRKDALKYDYETHKVPFVVWSNYDDSSRNLGLMEAGELLPSVFEQYNIHSNRFWNFIQDVKDVYAASDAMIVVDKTNQYTELSAMTEEQKEVYEKYRLLQYDYIWGKRYAAELWETN